jgi:predicted lactoylglutathione lyase
MIQGSEDDTAYVQKYDDGSFEIVIDQRLAFGEMCDYLVHEFAHVGSWAANEKDDHGPMWGIEYAKLYRHYLEVYEWWFSDVDAIRRST